jgi:ABC-type sugar transport system permease subunit
VIGSQAYDLAIHSGQFGPGSALSLTLVPLLVGTLIVLFRLFDAPGQETS